MQRSNSLVLLGSVLVGATLWIAGLTTEPFHANDSYDYAQMGREIRLGHGFSTLQAFPRHLAFLEERGLLDQPHWPNLYRYPLPTLLHAAAQSVAPDFVWAAVLQTGVWYVGSLPLFFLLARRFSTPLIGAALTLVFATDPLVRQSGYNGHTEALAIFLLLAALWLAFEAERSVAHRVALGVVCGLAFLNRTQAALLVPLVLFYVAARTPRGARLRSLLPVLGAAGLTLLPWALRDLDVVGQPLFSLNSTRNLFKQGRLDMDMMLHAPTSLERLLTLHGTEIRDQFLDYARRIFWVSEWKRMFPPLVYLPLLALWILALPIRRQDGSGFDTFKWGALGLFVASFLLHCLTVRNARVWAPMRPMILLAGAGSLVGLLPRSHPVASAWLARLLATALVVFAAFQLGPSLAATAPPGATQARVEKRLAPICDRLPGGAIVASDRSAEVALYCDRRSVRLPWKPGELLEMDRRLVPIDFVYASGRMSRPRGTNPRRNLYYQRYVESGFLEGRKFQDRYRPIVDTPEGGTLYRRREPQAAADEFSRRGSGG